MGAQGNLATTLKAAIFPDELVLFLYLLLLFCFYLNYSRFAHILYLLSKNRVIPPKVRFCDYLDLRDKGKSACTFPCMKLMGFLFLPSQCLVVVLTNHLLPYYGGYFPPIFKKGSPVGNLNELECSCQVIALRVASYLIDFRQILFSVCWKSPSNKAPNPGPGGFPSSGEQLFGKLDGEQL